MHEHLWKPFAGALTRTRSGVAAPACAPVRARRAECASRKKSPTPIGAVFVITAQALELLQENPCGYGARVSGATIFSYVKGNPLSNIDPYGLFGMADMPTLPDGLVDFFRGYGSYYGGLGNALAHMYKRSGMAGDCAKQRATENEAALAAALLSLSNPDVAKQAKSAAEDWASKNKSYLAGRLSAGGLLSGITKVGAYGGASLGQVAGMGDVLHNIDRVDASSAADVLRGILGDRMPDLPDVHRTECECQKK